MATTQIRKRQIADGAIDNAKIQAAAGIDTSKLAEGALFIKSTNLVTNETPTGVMNGINKDYTFAFTPLAGTLELKLNGQNIFIVDDYTMVGAVATLIDAPFSGESLKGTYRK